MSRSVQCRGVQEDVHMRAPLRALCVHSMFICGALHVHICSYAVRPMFICFAPHAHMLCAPCPPTWLYVFGLSSSVPPVVACSLLCRTTICLAMPRGGPALKRPRHRAALHCGPDYLDCLISRVLANLDAAYPADVSQFVQWFNDLQGLRWGSACSGTDCPTQIWRAITNWCP